VAITIPAVPAPGGLQKGDSAMARLYSIHNDDREAGDRDGNPDSGVITATENRQTPHSSEISEAVKTTLRKLLQTGRRSLLGRLHGIVMPVDPLTGWCVTDDGVAEDVVAGEATMIRVLCINRELQQIEDALRRISRNGFDNCVYCRGFIEPARLEGRPTVRSCQRCQDRLRLPALASSVQ